MNRSTCCKSELIYVSDGKIKIDRKHLPKLAALENIEGNTFYHECGACNKPCDITARPHFTNEQIDWICYQIGDWYLDNKNTICSYTDRTHRLGHAKEILKIMICGEKRNDE